MSCTYSKRDLQSANNCTNASVTVLTDSTSNSFDGVEDLWKLCRICAKSNQFMLPIFEADGSTNNLAQIIYMYLPIQVSVGDSLPLSVCSECAGVLLKWQELVYTSLKSDSLLKSKLQAHTGHLSENFKAEFIKPEPPLESEHFNNSSQTVECSYGATPQSRTPNNPCPFCTEAYDEDEDLRTHLINAHTENVFICEECDQCLSRLDLVIHMSKHVQQINTDDVQAATAYRAPEETPTINEILEHASTDLNHDECSAIELHAKDMINVDGLICVEQIPSNECRSIELTPIICDFPNPIESCPTRNRRNSVESNHSKNNSIDKQYSTELNQFKRYSFDSTQETGDLTESTHIKCDLIDSNTGKYSLIEWNSIEVQSVDWNPDDCNLTGQPISTESNHNKGESIESLNKQLQSPSTYHEHVPIYKSLDSNSKREIINNYKKSVVPWVKTPRSKERTCPICGKCFSVASSFHYHMKHYHGGIKDHTCDMCGKKFSMRSALAEHCAIHNDSKRFDCPICDKQFRSKASLYIHKKNKHSGDKNFTCDHCDQSFNWKQKLLRHLLTHTKQRTLLCSICARSFAIRYDLTRHMKTHNSNARFMCEVCDTAFSQRRYLKAHRKRKHSDL